MWTRGFRNTYSCEVIRLDYPEKELVGRARRGDVQAFEELISSYEKRILNIALGMLGNYDDACDVAQEVCLKIYRSINSFRDNSSFSTWVYRITANTCLDALRKREKTVHMTAISGDGEKFEIQTPDSQRSIDDLVESRETSDIVRSCISELMPEYRIIIILRDIYGYSYQEISYILNTNVGTVKSRLNRARALLKDRIKKREPFDDIDV